MTVFETTKLQIAQVCPLLVDLFASDEALLEKWHIAAGQGLEACAKRTASDLEAFGCEVFELAVHGKLAGYFAKEIVGESVYLTGFFLRPEYRTAEGHEALWSAIKSEFKRPAFFAGVYTRNIPAMKFLNKFASGRTDYPAMDAVVFTIEGAA